MSIEWRKPCRHGNYDGHTAWLGSNIPGQTYLCPGGRSATIKDLIGALIEAEVLNTGRMPEVPMPDHALHRYWSELLIPSGVTAEEE